MAHSWVQMFPDEYTAFKTYCELYPHNATLLVDTYNVLRHGVPDAIAQLLDKLVENARDFAPAGTAIRVSLERAGGFCRIAVENDGPAIDPDLLPRLFDSMVSVRPEGQSHGGHLGLGLANRAT